MACFEHLLLEQFIPTLKKVRLRVPMQFDLCSCGWRVALNALLFTKSIFNIEDVSIFYKAYQVLVSTILFK